MSYGMLQKCPDGPHKSIADFSRVVSVGKSKDLLRLWTCSRCGVEARWAAGWGYYGTIECRGCWLPVIDGVYCKTCQPVVEAAGPPPKPAKKRRAAEPDTKLPPSWVDPDATP